MKPQPHWLNKDLYPFSSHWVNIDGDEIHYVDEGSGPIILFIHGTPEWSFGFRDLIKGLRDHFRCVALDLLGFGLSDKPLEGDYTVKAHTQRLEKFIQLLDLKNLTLIANDFGGGIGLPYAIAHPENVSRIILFNTWMRSLKGDQHFSRPARLMDSWLGKILYLRLNFPVTAIMPTAFGDKKKLTKEIHAHYKIALPNAASRIAAYTFAKELMNASDCWQSNWNQLPALKEIPVQIFWGVKDTFVPVTELEKWKLALPHAEIITFGDAGHFVQEEKSEEMVKEIKRFLGTESR